jgi:hypothetical protein
MKGPYQRLCRGAVSPGPNLGGLSGSADPDKFYKSFSKIPLKFIKIYMI